jgi:hypothetical protein
MRWLILFLVFGMPLLMLGLFVYQGYRQKKDRRG